MITVLVTGIELFESDPTNPSWDIAQALDSTQAGGTVIVARQLLCVFGLVNEILVGAIEATPSALAFVLELATGRTEILVERVVINVIDARVPDNTSNQPVDTPVVTDGPTVYFSTLPIEAIVYVLCEVGVLMGVSQSAGTYNCNHLFYGSMHRIVMRAPQVRGGFTHAPTASELAARHAGRPSLSTDMQVKGIRLVVRTTLAMQSDLKMSTGAVHWHVHANDWPVSWTWHAGSLRDSPRATSDISNIRAASSCRELLKACMAESTLRAVSCKQMPST